MRIEEICKAARERRFIKRPSSIVNRKLFAVVLMVLPLAACARSISREDREANHYFAEILKREDRRFIGEDGFWEKNLLSNPSIEVRQWCALALGRIASPSALPWLYRSLHAVEASVRATSAFAIGETEDREITAARLMPVDPQAVSELKAMLDDSSLSVRMRVTEALGKIGGPAEAQEIVKRLGRFPYHGRPEERAYLGFCITALMRLNDPCAIPVLEKMTECDDQEIRRQSADALKQMRLGNSLPMVPAALTSENVQNSSPSTPTITDALAYAFAADRKNSTIAILDTTQGSIEIELFRQDAPATAAGFVLQAQGGRLNRLEFTRESPSLLVARMPQGLPAAWTLRSEVNMRPFEKGSVGLILPPKESSVAGVFIALAPQPKMDGIYTCFGRIISGMQAAERMAPGDRIRQVRIKETVSFQDYGRY
jgi:peptidyl-prolyl cis-trans isomerase B (cyclophilin B)